MSGEVEALAAIDKAWQTVADLCSGKIRWQMRVPAEFDRDPDLIIGTALQRSRDLISGQLTRVGDEERLRAMDVDRLAVAMNDAQIDPQEIRLGRDLGVVASRIAQKYDAALAATVREDERLRGVRPVLVAEDILEKWGTRTERGERITAEWGEPDERGWYHPTFTVHADDRLVDEERLRTAIDGVTNDPDDPSDPDAWTYNGTREELAAELVAALAPQPASPASQEEER